MAILLFFCSLAASTLAYQNTTDVWLQVVEITRGAGANFSIAIGVGKAAECFDGIGDLMQLIRDAIKLIQEGKFDVKIIAKILNQFAQWFSKEWYSCPELANVWLMLLKYFTKIGSNIFGYLAQFGLHLITGWFNMLKRTYQFIYFHAREEYCLAGQVVGVYLFELFFAYVVL